jgi:hypothetical protein
VPTVLADPVNRESDLDSGVGGIAVPALRNNGRSLEEWGGRSE